MGEYGNGRYCLVGPLNAKTAPMEVDVIDTAATDDCSSNPLISAALCRTLAALKLRGVNFMFGK